MQLIYANTNHGYLSVNILGLYDKKIANDNDEYHRLCVRRITCNAQGFFTFDNVKDGEYSWLLELYGK
jgi:hypothetical protein